jgi:hypothetical protein
MKKKLFIFVLVLLNSYTYSNIVNPKVYISEIYIVTPASWTIELAFPDDPSIIVFDSIVIENKIGQAKVISYYPTVTTSPGSNQTFLALVTNDSLSSPMEIDRNNDYIKVFSYLGGGVNYDYVAFGSYPGSYFPNFKVGYSIVCRAPDEFSLDKTPTLGDVNDEEGMMGTLHGY